MNKTSLKAYAPLGWVVGILGLALAGGRWFISQEFDSYAQASLIIGLIGVALSVYLNPGALETWLTGRQARYGGNATVMTIAMLGIAVLVNYLAYKNPQQWDVTEDQSNTLAPETLQAIQNLKTPVKALGFYKATNPSRSSTQSLLDRYKQLAGDNLDYEFHDPDAEPALARQYNVQGGDGQLVLVAGDSQETINFATEEQLTSAFIRLANPVKRAVYFLTSHGEADIADTAETGASKVAETLKQQNYSVNPLNLQVTITIPNDARVIVIAGPQVPVQADEVKTLEDHLNAHPETALVVLLDPALQNQTDPNSPEPLVDYLKRAWGVTVRQDIILDPLSTARSGAANLVLNAAYGNSEITTKLGRIASFFQNARSVATDDATQFPNLAFTPLALTSDQAWGETNFTAQPQPDGADAIGPLNFGVTVEDTVRKARVVMFGDADFARNLAPTNSANAQLFINSVNWAARDESLISLTQKTQTQPSLIPIDEITGRLLTFFTLLILPGAVLVLGGVMWYLRRRHV